MPTSAVVLSNPQTSMMEIMIAQSCCHTSAVFACQTTDLLRMLCSASSPGILTVTDDAGT